MIDLIKEEPDSQDSNNSLKGLNRTHYDDDYDEIGQDDSKDEDYIPGRPSYRPKSKSRIPARKIIKQNERVCVQLLEDPEPGMLASLATKQPDSF